MDDSNNGAPPSHQDLFDNIPTSLGDDGLGNTVPGHEHGDIIVAANQATALVIDTYNQLRHQFDAYETQHLDSSHGPAGPASGLASNVPMAAFGGGGSGVILQGTMMPAAAGGVIEQGIMIHAAAAAGASGSQVRRTSRITRLDVKPEMFKNRIDAAANLNVHRNTLTKDIDRFGWPRWTGENGTHPMIKISAIRNNDDPDLFEIRRESDLQELTETLSERFGMALGSYNLLYNFFGDYVPLNTEKQWLNCCLAYHVHRMPHIELVLRQI